MKKIKLLLTFITISFFISCSSDSEDSAIVPTTVKATGTISWNAFNASSTDITSLVTIGGEPASTYTVSAIKGDEITIDFNVSAKKTAKVKRELVMVAINIDSPSAADTAFLESITYVPDPNYTDFDGIASFKLGSNAPEPYDGKFDIVCIILEDGVALPNDYIIDPKIKIRARRE